MTEAGKMKRFFYGLRGTPTQEENRLFACTRALVDIEHGLKKKIALPESFRALWSAKETTETWSFELLLWDKLSGKGWPVYPGPDRNDVLCSTLHTMCIQAEGENNPRLNFDLLINDYKKGRHFMDQKETPRLRAATQFLLAHVGELEAVVAELKEFSPEGVTARHKCLLVAKDDANRPAHYDHLKDDFGVFAGMWRVPAHLKVLPMSETPSPAPRHKGFQL
jgi:hypothetical protein